MPDVPDWSVEMETLTVSVEAVVPVKNGGVPWTAFTPVARLLATASSCER